MVAGNSPNKGDGVKATADALAPIATAAQVDCQRHRDKLYLAIDGIGRQAAIFQRDGWQPICWRIGEVKALRRVGPDLFESMAERLLAE